MLGNADRVAVGHLGHRDSPVDRGLQVDVVGADTGGDRKLEVFRLGDALFGQISGPEGLGNHHVGVHQLALENAVRPVLVRCHDELVSGRFQERPEP